MSSIMQKSFSAGEITPALYSRTDISKYQTALRTCRNFYVMRHGGATNRPGTQFVCETKDSTKTARLIPFVFSQTQTYVIEFGDQYIRFVSNGEQVKNAAQNITDISIASPAIVTYSGADNFTAGDYIYISGVVGTIGNVVNNRVFKVGTVNTGANTFELKYTDDSDVDGSVGAYTSGGTLEEIYEISSPYLEADLPNLKFVQSADVITIVHPSYQPRTLSRYGETDWVLDTITFDANVDYPYSLSATIGGAAGAATYKYTVTAFDPLTGTETPMKAVPPSGSYLASVTNGNATLSSTNYVDISWTLTNYSTFTADAGTDVITHSISTPAVPANFKSVRCYTTGTMPGGLTSGTTYYMIKLTATTCKLATSYENAVAGTAINITSAGTGTLKIYAGYTPDELEFNVYKESNGVYGFIGVATGTTTFRDTGFTATVTDTPPRISEDFNETGDYPSTVTYYQQRLVLANTNNNVEKVWASKTGNFYDFSTSSPIQDDDAIIFNMAGRQVNEVHHLVDLGVLLMFTESGEFSAQGDSGGTLTPTAINTRQSSYNGSSSALAPIVIGNSAVYVQARGNNVRDINYKFESNDYSGDELSIYSSHLVDNYSLVDWAYQQVPHSILWTVRSDGTLLGMTYVKEQSMLAWHKHDFENGFVENICSVPEGSEDAVYMIIQRSINGVDKRYIEKFSSRKIADVKDIAILDCHLSYDGRNEDTAHTMVLSGSGWTYTDTLTLTSSTAFFTAADVGNQIQVYDTDGTVVRFTIDAFTSSTVVTGRPNRTVPATLQGSATYDWVRAVDVISGLWHLEGQSVSVFGDGNVVANPNNSSYVTVTVTDGSITLSEKYGVIYVGLPITADIQTLNIDSADATIIDKNKLIGKVTLFTQESRGIWAGTEEPTGIVDGLYELKIRQDEDYDAPVALKTDAVDIITEATWNNNGRVFIRQIDPVPLTILSITPSGYIPGSK